MYKQQAQSLRQTLVLFATLMLFWLMLAGSLQPDALIVGAIASLAISLIYREGLSFFTEFRFTGKALIAGFGYYGFFFRQLVMSNLQLAAVILNPKLPINPAIVKVRTRLQTRMGRLMLANSITLTPGTLSVELHGEYLYVHWVQAQAGDIEQATLAIVSGFESYLEKMYG